MSRFKRIPRTLVAVAAASAVASAVVLTSLPVAQASSSDPLPVLSSITPASGGSTAGGDTVTIRGSGFVADANGDVTVTGVFIGPDCGGQLANFASFSVIDDNTITAVTPAHAAGTVQIALGFTDPVQGGILSQTLAFTYGDVVSIPTVTGVSPNSGPVTGGTTITITGVGFTGATHVSFATDIAPATVISDTEIRVTSPSAPTSGGVHLQVCTPSWGYTAQIDADVFQYLDLIGPPLAKSECKKGGWMVFNNPVFRNEGECLNYVLHH